MQSEIKDKISYPVFLEFSFVDRNILFELEFKSSKYNSWNLCDADNIYVTHVHCYAWFIYMRTGCKCIHLDICIFGLYCKHHTTTTLPMDDNKKNTPSETETCLTFPMKISFGIKYQLTKPTSNCLCFPLFFPGSVPLSRFVLGSLVLLVLCVRTRTINPIVHTFE